MQSLSSKMLLTCSLQNKLLYGHESVACHCVHVFQRSRYLVQVALHVQVNLLAKHTNHSKEEITQTISRPKYFDPQQAVEYGIIDRVSNKWSHVHLK